MANDCPKCMKAMERREASDPPLKSWICTRCQGTWIEELHFNRLIREKKALWSIFQGGLGNLQSTSFPCFRCRGRSLFSGILSKNRMVLETCPSCHGYFLDAGELERILKDCGEPPLVWKNQGMEGELDQLGHGFFETLSQLNKLFLLEAFRPAEFVFGLEQRHNYQIYDVQQARIGALSETEWPGIVRPWFYGAKRGFKCRIADSQGQEVVSLSRDPFFSLNPMEWIQPNWETVVQAEGKYIGSVSKVWSFLAQRYVLADRNGDFAAIEIPLFSLRLEIPIQRTSACIRRHWADAIKAAFTTLDKYEVDFGSDPLTPEQKTIILCSVTVLDYDLFERESLLELFSD